MSINFKKYKKELDFGGKPLTIETGHYARQADGAVMVSLGDTRVLVTAVAVKSSEPKDWFPLTVNYQEKTYAAGKIPGGFFKREGRPAEKEVLICRLIDRPIRPLFPKGFTNEVQIIATVMSIDSEIDADIPAIIGASAALTIAGLPFNGPLGAAKIGYNSGEYILNPSESQLKESQLNLVVAGTKDAVLMVESEAKVLSEEVMLGAVMFGHQKMQPVIDAIVELAEEVGNPKWDWQPPAVDAALLEQVKAVGYQAIEAAFAETDKAQRNVARKKAHEDICQKVIEQSEDIERGAIMAVVQKLESELVRGKILAGEPRIDGRDTKTVRPIDVETGILPKAHGSAVFTRGETQAIVVTTLGGARDSQIIDALLGEYKDRFMLHYNFPPYSVGEVGFTGSPKRREIGHGRLARRSLEAVLPNEEEFPYVTRVVSEITESNGSSSMASVCGGSLSLMDAGVPLKAPVAGIAMGLIKQDDKFEVLTDILGDEDHLGDMDFKVAGTAEGITALQMDIKIDGITEEIMQVALAQAKEGRSHILGIMNESLSEARSEVAEHAPRIMSVQVHPDKIRDIIGKGGAVIRGLCEETGTIIDINDEGVVTIVAENAEAGEHAKSLIADIVAEIEVGKTYRGKVVKLMDFGAFVNVLPGKDGLVHVSQLSEERVENVADYVQEGQEVIVKVLEVDRQGRVRLSMKEANEADLDD